MKALALDDSLADAHVDMALVSYWYDWDWPAARREFQRAIELAPNSAAAHQYFGASLVWAGDVERGIVEGKRAVSLDPVSVEALRMFGEDYYFAHQYDNAIAQLRDCIQMEPNYWFAHLSMGRVYAAKHDWARAQAELETATRLEPRNPEALAALSTVLAQSGKTKEARDLIQKLETSATQSYVSPYQFAVAYTGLGNKKDAIASLQKMCAEKSMHAMWMKTDPALDSLRQEPQFKLLLSSILCN
jgi:tetratricopeptide (TPR) repeat protein